MESEENQGQRGPVDPAWSDRVVRARDRLGLSVEELARLVGVNVLYLRELEGAMVPLDWRTGCRLSQVLGDCFGYYDACDPRLLALLACVVAADPSAVPALADWLEEEGDDRAAEVRVWHQSRKYAAFYDVADLFPEVGRPLWWPLGRMQKQPTHKGDWVHYPEWVRFDGWVKRVAIGGLEGDPLHGLLGPLQFSDELTPGGKLRKEEARRKVAEEFKRYDKPPWPLGVVHNDIEGKR